MHPLRQPSFLLAHTGMVRSRRCWEVSVIYASIVIDVVRCDATSRRFDTRAVLVPKQMLTQPPWKLDCNLPLRTSPCLCAVNGLYCDAFCCGVQKLRRVRCLAAVLRSLQRMRRLAWLALLRNLLVTFAAYCLATLAASSAANVVLRLHPSKVSK